MSTITTRSGKGSRLTHAEMDANFDNLNTDKLEATDLTGGTGVTATVTTAGDVDISIGQAVGTGDDVTFNSVTADNFTGDLSGPVKIACKSGEAFSRGDAVYISGVSGNFAVVSKAVADNAAKMPALGLADTAATGVDEDVDVIIFGEIVNLDTSSFSEGDELFITTTGGAISTTAPTGETGALQKIAKVEKSHASTGILIVMGAMRTNAVPNLNDGNIFIGNASNQAETASLDTKVGALNYIKDITGENIGDLTDVNITSVANDEILVYNSTSGQWENATNTGGLTNLIDDTTPQLGGALDVNGFKITNSAGIAVTIDDKIVVEGGIRIAGSTGSPYAELIAPTSFTGSASYTLTLPADDGASGEVLTTDGTGVLSWTTGAGIADLVDDTTPQLGGQLDVNGNKIISTSNGNIDIEPNGTGNVFLGNLHFDADQTVGAGQDNYVLTYDDATGLISLEAAPATGLQNVVEDNTPQLGGNLDLNSSNITGTGDITPTGNIKALGNNAYVEAAKIYGRDQDSFGLWLVPEGGASGTNSLRVHTDANGFMQIYSPNTPMKLRTVGGTDPDDITIEAGGNINLNPASDGGAGSVKLGGSFDVNGNSIANGLGTEVNFGDNIRVRGTGYVFFEEGTSGTGIKLQAPTGVTGTPTFTLPSADGTSGQVLQTNGSGVLSFATVSGGGGLTDVVDDTTPQLGGNLDVNGNSIVSVSAGNISITPDTTGSVIIDGLSHPQADGTTGQFMTTNGAGQLSFASVTQATGSELENVVEDTTPQLGGNLDVNGNSIVSVSNGNITLTPNGTGDVVLGTMTFDADQTIGAGEDNYVLTYDNATGKISLEAAAGGGGGLADVVDDTTPQLGGDLDTQTFDIDSDTGSARGTHLSIGTDITTGQAYSGTHAIGPVVNRYNATLNANSRVYGYIQANKLVLNNANTTVSGSNGRMRFGYTYSAIDVNGCNYGADANGRGIVGNLSQIELFNNNSTYSVNLPRVCAVEAQIFPSIGYDINYNTSTSQDMTIDKLIMFSANVFDDTNTGQAGETHIGTEVITFHNRADTIDSTSNIVWDSGARAYNIKNDNPQYLEKFGSVDSYREHCYEATHSSAATYTVDFTNGNIQYVTLSNNITSFTMSNFPTTNGITGKTEVGSVTLFLQQDGTGGRTISFTAGASETFKIANGITTADTGANNFTVAHVMKVGSTYLWTISGNYT